MTLKTSAASIAGDAKPKFTTIVPSETPVVLVYLMPTVSLAQRAAVETGAGVAATAQL